MQESLALMPHKLHLFLFSQESHPTSLFVNTLELGLIHQNLNKCVDDDADKYSVMEVFKYWGWERERGKKVKVESEHKSVEASVKKYFVLIKPDILLNIYFDLKLKTQTAADLPGRGWTNEVLVNFRLP